MNITTREELQKQQNEKDTCWLITENKSEEVIILTVPYLYDSRTVGDVVLEKADGEKVTFKIELNKPIEGVDLRTEPDTNLDVLHLARPASLTVDQVNEVIQNWEDDEDGFGYAIQERRYIRGLGEVELVEQVGGEGEGDHYHVVFKAGGKYWELDAFYSSWEGTEFEDEAYEVTPQEVKVTEFKRV